ncbi:MAG: HD family phosphohydrolase [Prevotella sp.]|nr:HD family phosphohydrolase [Prevotella sp.]
MEDKKAKFIELLRSTKRENIEHIIKVLEDLGFFTAPASTRFHLSHEGGLLEHSLNVCDMALELRELMIRKKKDLEQSLPLDSVIIASLLHDVCKADVYKPEDKVKRFFSNMQSHKGYSVDYSNFPLGHGEKSVFVLMKNGLILTDDEIAAIRWHMQAWDLPFQSYEMLSNINAAKKKYPLLNLILAADGLAAHMIEA